jgi:hypothetical protein
VNGLVFPLGLDGLQLDAWIKNGQFLGFWIALVFFRTLDALVCRFSDIGSLTRQSYATEFLLQASFGKTAALAVQSGSFEDKICSCIALIINYLVELRIAVSFIIVEIRMKVRLLRIT